MFLYAKVISPVNVIYLYLPNTLVVNKRQMLVLKIISIKNNAYVFIKTSSLTTH